VYADAAEPSLPGPRDEPTRAPVIVVSHRLGAFREYEVALPKASFKVLPASATTATKVVRAHVPPATRTFVLAIDAWSSRWSAVVAELRRSDPLRGSVVTSLDFVTEDDPADATSSAMRRRLCERLSSALATERPHAHLIVDGDEAIRHTPAGSADQVAHLTLSPDSSAGATLPETTKVVLVECAGAERDPVRLATMLAAQPQLSGRTIVLDARDSRSPGSTERLAAVAHALFDAAPPIAGNEREQ
jgi:hypothetical protein